MPGSRWDSLSGALNFCVTFLCVFILLEQMPNRSLGADELVPAPVDISYTTAAERCAHTQTLPTDVSSYLQYASRCLGENAPEMQMLDGDVLVMFHRLNEVRVEQGLPPVVWHPGAAEVARLHGIDMLRRDYFSHQSLEGLRNDDRLRRLRRNEIFGYAGENLAWYRDGWPETYNPGLLQEQLELSPRHFDVMINSDYSHAGAAIVRHGNTYVGVQVFLSAEGYLDENWPSRIFPGLTFDLPTELNGRPVGGWILERKNGEMIARGRTNRIIVPEVDGEGLVRLVVLVQASRSHFLMLNGPVSDLATHAP